LKQNVNRNNPRAPSPSAEQNPQATANGEHVVGTGVGAIGVGAAAGLAGGAIAGPVGMVAGAAVGALVGGLAGKAAAEVVNPNVEAKFWQESHSSKPYALTAFGYDEFSPAYRYGWESFARHGGESRTFDSVETALGRGWDKARGASRLGWDHARLATRDAWNRVELATRGPAAR
jgi:hypothetical protein